MTKAYRVHDHPSIIEFGVPGTQLDWLLGTASAGRPIALVTRVTGYLSFTGLVLAVTAIVAATWVRLSADRAPVRSWKGSVRHRIRAVWDDPVRWRETYDPGGRRIVALVGIAALIPIVAWTVTAWDGNAPGVTHGLSKISHGYLLVLTLAAGVVVGLRSAVTLVDERVRGTREVLWLVGVEPAAMIRSKLAAILTPAFVLMPVIAVIAFLSYGEVFDDTVVPRAWLGAVGNVAVALAHALLVAAMSLLISAHARSSRVALLLEVVLLFVITLGPMMLIVGASPFLPESIVQILAASSPLVQVSLVGANATRFPVPVVLGVLCAELVISLAVISWTGHSLDRRPAPALLSGPFHK